MDENIKPSNPFQPLIISIAIVVGILLGVQITKNGGIKSSGKGSSNEKLDEILNYIENEYVDTINKNQLTDAAINSLLESLDPHSAYIPASELQATNEPLKGNFDGIGIEFNILKDTIIVVAALAGGPSELLGIRAGDRIVKIDNKNVASIKIANNDVLKKLRGEGGTKVKVGIKRANLAKLIDFTITRGKIPIYSVDAAYMASPTTGYIKISRFAATTYDEYLNAFNKLKQQGLQQLILDLRGNPGGYLTAAIDIADEFLDNGKLIVYTQGNSRKKDVSKATTKGGFEKGKLIVLIDEGSASASEIVSGALQDNDRATLIGRRSFGKGLVQEQTDLSDGSALRLTIARYYTPSGRCIQKPYTLGEKEEYYEEETSRYKNGELQSADSIKFADSLKFKTLSGRIVYGGGGVMPDVFVSIDTTGRSMYLSMLFYKGILNQFSITYVDKNRNSFIKYKSFSDYDNTFVVTESLLNELVQYAKKEGLEPNTKEFNTSKKIIETQLKALIARNLWRNDGYYPIVNKLDNTYKRALQEVGK